MTKTKIEFHISCNNWAHWKNSVSDKKCSLKFNKNICIPSIDTYICKSIEMQKEKKTYKHINIKDLYTISYIYIVKKKAIYILYNLLHTAKITNNIITNYIMIVKNIYILNTCLLESFSK